MREPSIYLCPKGRRTLVRRSYRRMCPSCGQEGMLLWMGGLTGTLYKCPNCQYLGPIVIEDESSGTQEEDREYTVRLSRVNSTLNWVGLLFGVSFMAVGLIVGFSPLPLSGGSIGAYGVAVFAIGAVLVVVSGLFWLIDRSRGHDRREAASASTASGVEN